MPHQQPSPIRDKSEAHPVVRDDDLPRALDPVHVVQPLRPPLRVHPRKHDHAAGAAPVAAPLLPDRLHALDGVLALCALLRDGREHDERRARRVHDLLERALVELERRREAIVQQECAQLRLCGLRREPC